MGHNFDRNFDRVVDRRASDSVKWPDQGDVLPLSIGDMDFAAPPAVIDALQRRIGHGIFGYPAALPDALIDVVVERMSTKYGWRVEPDWIVRIPGVVPAIYGCCRAFAELGESIMAPSPNYHHLLDAPVLNGRKLAVAPAQFVDGTWRIDLQAARRNVIPRTRLFLLCNPYNPLGRVLTRTELEGIAGLCLEQKMILVSDEIHSELIIDPAVSHTVVAGLNDEIAEQTITLISPNKTFNLAGLPGSALAIVANVALRERLEEYFRGIAPHTGVLAYAATIAAYRDCDDWLEDLLSYLRGNHEYLYREIDRIEGISMTLVEATYFAWLDVSELQAKLGIDDIYTHFLDNGLALSAGTGMGSDHHVRLNFGVPRSSLEEGVRRLRAATML